ncbi:MAG: hypothetical protein OXC01_19000 [Immundisolibacterales bacterium]|nr:hypothetical protein [Immundisolibacterales bacterium]
MRAILGAVRAGCNHRPGRVRSIGVRCRTAGRLAGGAVLRSSWTNWQARIAEESARIAAEEERRARDRAEAPAESLRKILNRACAAEGSRV